MWKSEKSERFHIFINKEIFMLSSAMLFRKNLQLLFLLTAEQISCSAEFSMKKKDLSSQDLIILHSLLVMLLY